MSAAPPPGRPPAAGGADRAPTGPGTDRPTGGSTTADRETEVLGSLTDLVHVDDEARVVVALQRLDREQRRLVRLSLQTATRRELAERAGLDLEALADRLDRARRALDAECARLRGEDDA